MDVQPVLHSASLAMRAIAILCIFLVFQILSQEIKVMFLASRTIFIVAATTFARHGFSLSNNGAVDLGWYQPNKTAINNLTTVINSTGFPGFLYNGSYTPEEEYGTVYNWCNMPHVRKTEYVKPAIEYEFHYVEVVSNTHDNMISLSNGLDTSTS
jgi:hypothetical protein